MAQILQNRAGFGHQRRYLQLESAGNAYVAHGDHHLHIRGSNFQLARHEDHLPLLLSHLHYLLHEMHKLRIHRKKDERLPRFLG